jgi:hypothetical protein
MSIETLDDVLNEIADKAYIYGACKSLDPDGCSQSCTFCCRVGFMNSYEDRIRDAIVNEIKVEVAFALEEDFAVPEDIIIHTKKGDYVFSAPKPPATNSIRAYFKRLTIRRDNLAVAMISLLMSMGVLLISMGVVGIINWSAIVLVFFYFTTYLAFCISNYQTKRKWKIDLK